MPKAQKDRRNKPVHPHSRVASQMARSMHKEQKADGRFKEKTAKLTNLGEKLKWFQENIEDEKVVYSKEETCEMIERYIGRYEDELEQMDIVNSMKGRTGNQYASRKNVINMIVETERREFDTQGFEIPDIMNGKHIKFLREWGGELKLIPNIKLRSVKSIKEQTTSTSSTEAENKSDNTSVRNDIEMKEKSGK